MRITLNRRGSGNAPSQATLPGCDPDVGSISEGDMVLAQGGLSKEPGSLGTQSRRKERNKPSKSNRRNIRTSKSRRLRNNSRVRNNQGWIAGVRLYMVDSG
jgi:hypothetical protein